MTKLLNLRQLKFEWKSLKFKKKIKFAIIKSQ